MLFLHPAMLLGTAGEECDTRFVVVAVFQPLRPSDTSPIFCCAKHRGGVLKYLSDSET